MSDSFPTDEAVLLARSEGRLGPLVEQVLGELVGLPWRDLNRAADMPMLGFGELVSRGPLRPRPDLDPERQAERERRWARPMARCCLHVQCPLRIDGPTGPYVGAQDVYRAAEPPHDWIDDERTTFGATLFDRRVTELEAARPEGPHVTAVHADAGGGFVLDLTGGWTITVAPSSASTQEFWRYFYADGGPHFVLFDED